MSTTAPLSRTSAATQSPAAPAAKQRDPWFDNAKMLLVTLVVVGHSWVLLPDNLAGNWLYDFLYLWHVPAFVMVTGYLSRSFTWSRRNVGRLVTAVAMPYVVFEAAIAAFRYWVGGEELDMLFADPHWPMWYLAVLFLWRLATPVLRSPGALAAAVAVSLFGGYLGAEVFDTARAMGLLPFFVMGLLVRREHLDLLRQRAARLVGAAVMTLGFLGASLIDGRLATEWLYWRSGYSELDATLAEGMAVRAGLLVVCTLLAVSFFTLVPRRGGWFARLGAATLVVYLFHGFFVKTAEYAGLGAWAAEHPALAVLVTTTASVVLALALAAPPVARRLNVAVDPVGSWRRHRQHRQH